MGCLYIPNCVFHFGFTKLNWHVLGEVCCGSQPISCVTSDKQNLGKRRAQETRFYSVPSLLQRILCGSHTQKGLISRLKSYHISRERGQMASCEPCGSHDCLTLWGRVENRYLGIGLQGSWHRQFFQFNDLYLSSKAATHKHMPPTFARTYSQSVMRLSVSSFLKSFPTLQPVTLKHIYTFPPSLSLVIKL